MAEDRVETSGRSGEGGSGSGSYGRQDRDYRDRDRDRDRDRGAPIGYFRAQPLDLGLKRRRKVDPFVEDSSLVIDYKDPKLLSRFVSERGRILSRRMTGLSAHNQRKVRQAIKRAQHLALLPICKRA